MEEPLSADHASPDHYDNPARARLRGLARNPRIPADLLTALLDQQRSEVAYAVEGRREWTDEQVRAIACHPDTEVRRLLAQSRGLTPQQRATLVEDSSGAVLHTLAIGPDYFSYWTFSAQEWLPVSACERLLERKPQLRLFMEDNRHLPREFRDRLFPPSEPARPGDAQPLSRAEAEALARDDRGELLPWVTEATDPELIRWCALSGHVGLRRSAASNRNLTPELIAVLSADDDFAVRLLLCENHDDVPSELVLTMYLEATPMTASRLLQHPGLVKEGLARLAGSPDPRARALAVLDPHAPPELIDRLSHDPEPVVRRSMADDPRLTPQRVLDLFDDPLTTEPAAANPLLPEPVMRRILREAATLADD